MADEPKTVEQRIGVLEDVLSELIDKTEALTKEVAEAKKTAAAAGTTKAKGLFGGKRAQTPIKDLKTGEVYISKAAVGKKFASEVGKDPTDTFAWYTVMNKLKMDDGSDRFVVASEAEATAIRAKMAAAAEEDQKARQKALDEEEAKKVAANKPPQPGANKPKK